MIELRELFQINADIAPAWVTEAGPLGDRKFIAVPGGTIEGERIKGRFLAGGSDVGLMRADGVFVIDVRTPIELEDGTIIYMRGNGLTHGPDEVMAKVAAGEDVDSSLYYFREAFFFEAPPGNYEWLNRIIAIGKGAVNTEAVKIDVFEIL